MSSWEPLRCSYGYFVLHPSSSSQSPLLHAPYALYTAVSHPQLAGCQHIVSRLVTVESSVLAELLLIGERSMYGHTRHRHCSSATVLPATVLHSSYVRKHVVIRKWITVLLAGFMLWYALQQESML